MDIGLRMCMCDYVCIQERERESERERERERDKGREEGRKEGMECTMLAVQGCIAANGVSLYT